MVSPQGLFCANFSFSRGPFPPCRRVWCGNCYRPQTLVSFFINKAKDEDGFVWTKRGDEKRFRVGRNGDHLMSHFQCDLCVFRNIHFRNPSADNSRDELACCMIRRANLDVLWSREPSTVRNNLRLVKKGMDFNLALGQEDMYPHLGPCPLKDATGHAVALQILMSSTQHGSYHKDHQQYESIRKLRSAFSNLWRASVEGVELNYTLGRDRAGAPLSLDNCPTDSHWFRRFDKGLKKRMGQDVRSQLGFSIEVIKKLVTRLEEKWINEPGGPHKDDLLGCMVYSTLCYVNALRGNEGFKIEIGGVRRYIDHGRNHPRHPHCIAPLLGRFKGEDGERYHLLLMAPITRSGLEPQRMLDLLVRRREEQGFLVGLAFVDEVGVEVEPGLYNSIVLEMLGELQLAESGTVPVGDRLFHGVALHEVYGIFRSFKRGAITRAQEANVATADVEFIGRWRKIENSGGRKPSRSIREHYTELVQVLDARLRFSRAL